jgi:hypothetical protein
MSDRPQFAITVQPDDDTPHVEKRLARIVKALGRQFGFRCVRVAPIAGDQGQDVQQAGDESTEPTD